MSTAAAPNRNDPCPCGSGKKYKRCCLGQEPVATKSGHSEQPDANAGGPRTLLKLATDHHRAGRLEPAAEAYATVLAKKPREAAALFGLGQIRGTLGDFPEGIRHLQRAVAIDRNRVEYLVALGALLHLGGNADEAIRMAERAVTLEPRNVRALALLASCHERRNRLEDAVSATRRALAIAPRDARSIVTLASLYRRTDRLEEAREELETLLTRGPALGDQYARAFNELGHVLDRQGAFDAAFDAFTRCGEETERDPLAKRTKRDVWQRRIAGYTDALTPELIGRWTAGDFAGERPAPVFLVGFIRSGTTLIEQVLAAHPRVETSDERPTVVAVRRTLTEWYGATDDMPETLAKLDLDAARRLRGIYWQEAERLVGKPLDDRVLVDKNPLTLIDLGLLNTIFPDARVIVLLRDPRDVCLSAFMQLFEINTGMVNFLSWPRTGAFYAQVMGLWLKLRTILTMPWCELRYEDLVSDLPRFAPALLEAAGLDWDDRVLAFHEQARERAISTPSYAAVAEPVHRKAVARWRGYARHLEVIRGHLDPFVAEFGYGE